MMAWRCGVALVVADRMADGQISLMAVAAIAQGLNMFECRVRLSDVQAADPAGHLAV